MSFHDSILAASDEGIGRLIMFGIVVVIWIIGAISSAIKKQREEWKRRREMQMPRMPQPSAARMPAPVRGRPIPQPAQPVDSRITWPPIPALRNVPAQPPQAPQRNKQMLGRQGKKKKSKSPPPLPVPRGPQLAQPAVLPLPASKRTIESTAIGQGESRRATQTTGADAAAIRRWLTPQTLRTQFILTEVLQPPVAIRPDRH